MTFKKFRELNTQHKEEYDGLDGQFTGDPALIHKKVESDEPVEEAAAAEEQKERDPLEDTPEEDENAGFIARNLTEEDRLHYTVLAIENDCHIVPQGSFRMTSEHEVERNVSFRGLTSEDCFDLAKYSHFRNVQDVTKKEKLEDDDAVF